jgi:hypothetical protein
MEKGRFFSRRFIDHRCCGEAFVIPADGVCQSKEIPKVFTRIIVRRCL